MALCREPHARDFWYCQQVNLSKRSLDMPSGETLNWRCDPGVPRDQFPLRIGSRSRPRSCHPWCRTRCLVPCGQIGQKATPIGSLDLSCGEPALQGSLKGSKKTALCSTGGAHAQFHICRQVWKCESHVQHWQEREGGGPVGPGGLQQPWEGGGQAKLQVCGQHAWGRTYREVRPACTMRMLLSFP